MQFEFEACPFITPTGVFEETRSSEDGSYEVKQIYVRGFLYEYETGWSVSGKFKKPVLVWDEEDGEFSEEFLGAVREKWAGVDNVVLK
jgi:hypothetical protein